MVAEDYSLRRVSFFQGRDGEKGTVVKRSQRYLWFGPCIWLRAPFTRTSCTKTNKTKIKQKHPITATTMQAPRFVSLIDRRGSEGQLGKFVCQLAALRPSNMLVYGTDLLRYKTATQRQRLQIKLSISSSHCILTPG